jgi:hypothetical protein
MRFPELLGSQHTNGHEIAVFLLLGDIREDASAIMAQVAANVEKAVDATGGTSTSRPSVPA